jgi:hypothetical protein
MKTAFYIEDGLEQIVLTPQTDWERNVLALIHNGSREMTLKQGSFFECNGGWIRNTSTPQSDSSTIIILKKKPVPA